MSGQIVKVILFYSKKSERSLEMKDIIDETGIDIDCVSVDSSEIRERVLSDTKYGIREVPSVLVLFSTGRHKVYTRRGLETWFGQLVANIKAEQERELREAKEAEAAAQRLAAELAVPVIAEKGIAMKQPVYQRRMAAPGRRTGPTARASSESDPDTIIQYGGSDGDLIDYGGDMMINNVDGDVDDSNDNNTSIQSGMSVGSVPHSVKKSGPTPSELAKKMMEMRDNIEEEVDANKPFM